MSIKKIQRPFSINEWKRGAKIETRAGMPVRILCTDLKDRFDERNIIAARTIPDGDERVEYCCSNGQIFDDCEDSCDIVIVEEQEISDRWADDIKATGDGWYIDSVSAIFPIKSASLNSPKFYNIFATEKQAKSALAMTRISQIMANDERYGGVVTDEEWNDTSIWKYVLYRRINYVACNCYQENYHFIAFHTVGQRDLFLAENEQLVKDYLMID